MLLLAAATAARESRGVADLVVDLALAPAGLLEDNAQRPRSESSRRRELADLERAPTESCPDPATLENAKCQSSTERCAGTWIYNLCSTSGQTCCAAEGNTCRGTCKKTSKSAGDVCVQNTERKYLPASMCPGGDNVLCCEEEEERLMSLAKEESTSTTYWSHNDWVVLASGGGSRSMTLATRWMYNLMASEHQGHVYGLSGGAWFIAARGEGEQELNPAPANPSASNARRLDSSWTRYLRAGTTDSDGQPTHFLGAPFSRAYGLDNNLNGYQTMWAKYIKGAVKNPIGREAVRVTRRTDSSLAHRISAPISLRR